MGMKKKSFSQSQKGDEVDISPLIDMVFILLIFFIVTTVFIDERGFETPGSSNSPDDPDEPTEPVIFRITRDGNIVLDDAQIPFGAVRRTIINRSQQDTVPVIVEVEQGARSGLAIRVYDEALLAGAESPTLKIAE